jgi:hypothetical protein
MLLIDTDVLWQMRGAASADAAVCAWAARQPRLSLFVSALAVMEIGHAAESIAHADKTAGAAVRRWLTDKVLPAFEGRLLAVDAAVAGRAARLTHGHPTDGLVASTALEHGLALATRTPAAFKAMRVKLVDPGRSDGAVIDADDGDDWRQASRGGPVWLRNLFARG